MSEYNPGPVVLKMLVRSWKRKAVVLAVILIAGVLIWDPLGNLIFSARVALSLKNLAAGDTGRHFDIREVTVRRQTSGGRGYEALVYHPAHKPASTAVILVAGLSELGCYHPRLVALSRSLADIGLMVITPDVREFRNFEISAEPINQILFWYGQVPELPGGKGIKKTGLAGISFSGTVALIAASRPELRDRVAFVTAIGPYSNLLRCARLWFAADPGAPPGDYYPTRFYAKWILMRSALDIVEDEKERLFLRDVLEDLLLQRKVPPAGEMTPQGRRWYDFAIMRANKSDTTLSEKIEQHLAADLYSKLDPQQILHEIRCPVYLIHGAYDDLIPPGESVELQERIPDSHLLITPFLTHTHPTDAPMGFWQKARALQETVVFCYRFSGAVL